jgi:hypothetical protein
MDRHFLLPSPIKQMIADRDPAVVISQNSRDKRAHERD